jgi:hypothetical protein
LLVLLYFDQSGDKSPHSKEGLYESDPIGAGLYPFATSDELESRAFAGDLSAQILLKPIC